MKSIPDWETKLRAYFEKVSDRSEMPTMPEKIAVEKKDDGDSDDSLEDQFDIINRESEKSASQTQTK